MKLKYFGTDGVRGIANESLSPELAFKLGRCGGYVLTQHATNKERAPRVLVARDTRISGQMLEHALIAGLLSVGIEVFDLGVITTPGVAYLVRCLTKRRPKLKLCLIRMKTRCHGHQQKA